MAEAKRKYRILPGVPAPDLEEILKASSDYSEPGELEYTTAKNYQYETTEEINAKKGKKVVVKNESIEELQKLGDEVSEAEEREKMNSKNWWFLASLSGAKIQRVGKRLI